MLVLRILGVLLLLFLLAVLTPVRVRAAFYSGGWSVRLRYGLIWYTITPERLKKRAKKAKAKPEKAAKPGKKEEEKKEKGKEKPKRSFAEYREMARPLLKSAKKAVTLLCRHFIIDKLRVALAVGGKDAHSTALLYAKTGAALAIFVQVLDGLFVLKNPKVGAVPDFTRPGVRYDISAELRIRPIFLLAAGAYVLAALLKALSEEKKLQKSQGKVNNTIPC